MDGLMDGDRHDGWMILKVWYRIFGLFSKVQYRVRFVFVVPPIWTCRKKLPQVNLLELPTYFTSFCQLNETPRSISRSKRFLSNFRSIGSGFRLASFLSAKTVKKG